MSSWLLSASGRWAALVALGLFVGGVVAAEDKVGKEPAKEKKKEAPRARALPFPDLDELFDGFGPGLDPKDRAELKKQMAEARKRMEEALRRFDRQPFPNLPAFP